MISAIETHKKPQIAAAALQRVLAGVRVLIVEDDYYLAMDAKIAMESAGAEVIGPFARLEPVRRALSDHHPNCAVVDINLGAGPSFEAAQHLEAAGTPFLFLTGYSLDAIPHRFQHIPQLRKPMDGDDLVEAVRQLCP